MTYKVELETFNGPMDLLLYLVRRSEVEITEVPIAKIADQFVTYVELMESLDVEYAAEFLVMAATLMDIKARTLVPQEVAANDDAEVELIDPREELIRELLEYKKIRDAALYLGQRLEDRTYRFESGAQVPELDEKPLEEIEVWDLFSAFSGLLKAIGAASQEIVSNEVPVETYMQMLLDKVSSAGRLPFEDLFDGTHDRGVIVGMFLALLELARLRRIRALQERDFGRIFIEVRGESD